MGLLELFFIGAWAYVMFLIFSKKNEGSSKVKISPHQQILNPPAENPLEKHKSFIDALPDEKKDLIHWLFSDSDSSFDVYFTCRITEKYEYNKARDYRVQELTQGYTGYCFIADDPDSCACSFYECLTKKRNPTDLDFEYDGSWSESDQFFKKDGSLISDDIMPKDHDYNPMEYPVEVVDWDFTPPESELPFVTFEANGEKREFFYRDFEFIKELFKSICLINK